MKTLLRLLPFLALAFVSLLPAVGAQDQVLVPEQTLLKADKMSPIAAARAADDERLAATKSGERARLDAIFSDQLHYAHSNGKIDTKASYIESLVTRATVYESFDYKQREFKVAGPGVVIMTARVLIKAVSNGARADNDLNILAVWREENGKWRFFAWQSCKNPPAEAAPAAKK